MTARIDPFITHCLAMMFGIAAYFTAPIDPPSLLLPLPENPVAAAFGLAAMMRQLKMPLAVKASVFNR